MSYSKLSYTKLGSSATFSAQGGWGKEKIISAVKNFASPSEGEAEGGCGGNSASPEPKRSPAALLVQSRQPKKSFVFLLEEKIGRAQIKNREQNFSLSERASASGGGAEHQNSAFGFSLKKVRISFSVRSCQNNRLSKRLFLIPPTIDFWLKTCYTG
ncbi:MAG: hypothetical protein Q8N37_04770 [bacterium]|nr:hypothetical protein [bacterium]